MEAIFKVLRGKTPKPVQSMALKLERNRDKIVQDFFLASQKDTNQLQGRVN